MFQGYLGNTKTYVPLYSAADAIRRAAATRRPVPPELAKCNTFTVPLGPEPARGWVLVLRKDLNALAAAGKGLNDRFFLTFQADVPAAVTMKWQNLIIAREPQSVLPGITADDPAGVVLVELADVTWLLRNPNFGQAITSSYNLIDPSVPGATSYFADTLNGGVAWTWAGIAGDVWGVMAAQLGAFPGLPFTPNGTPQGWTLQGVTAWDALASLLRRIGCAVRRDLTRSSQFTIVQIGAADPATDTTLAAAETAFPQKIHDAEPAPLVIGLVPAGVAVHFSRLDETAGTYVYDPRLVEVINVANPAAAGTEPGVYTPLWDDLPVATDGAGNVTNLAALTTRAQERAADYFRQVTGAGGSLLWKRYSGLVAVTAGSTLKSVAWHADAAGAVWTEAVRHPRQPGGIGNAGNVVVPQLPSAPVQCCVCAYTTPGTVVWTPPTGLLWLDVELVGGGGGGGVGGGGSSNPVNVGSGGGAGGYARRVFKPSELPASVTLTIGAGGAGQLTGAGNTVAGSGGSTSFGTLLVVGGGSGGSNGAGNNGVNADNMVSGGAGGVGNTGSAIANVSISGNPGGPALSLQAAGFPLTGISGTGGASPLGPGGIALGVANNGVLPPVSGNGGGGGGASWAANAPGAGDFGLPGAVILRMYSLAGSPCSCPTETSASGSSGGGGGGGGGGLSRTDLGSITAGAASVSLTVNVTASAGSPALLVVQAFSEKGPPAPSLSVTFNGSSVSADASASGSEPSGSQLEGVLGYYSKKYTSNTVVTITASGAARVVGIQAEQVTGLTNFAVATSATNNGTNGAISVGPATQSGPPAVYAAAAVWVANESGSITWGGGFSDGGQDLSGVLLGEPWYVVEGYQIANSGGTFTASLTGLTQGGWAGVLVLYN